MSNRKKPAASVFDRAEQVDLRRQEQIDNQKRSIDGLLAQLNDAKQVVWGQSVVIYCLLEMLGGKVTIPRSAIDSAPGGSVSAITGHDGALHVHINGEENKDG